MAAGPGRLDFRQDDDAYFKNARLHIEAFEQMFASDREKTSAS